MTSALKRKVRSENDAKKITIVDLFVFFCELTKSREPMSESSFREYVSLDTGLFPEAKDLLGAFFKTDKRYSHLFPSGNLQPILQQQHISCMSWEIIGHA